MPSHITIHETSQRELTRHGQNSTLPHNLSYIETWGFGLTGHLSWISAAPILHEFLGAKAFFVWLPAAIVGVLLNLQVKRLGTHWSSMAGGTANYTTRLLSRYPHLGAYAAIAYYLSWVAYLPLNGIILAELLQDNLQPAGIPFPKIPFLIAYTLVPYVLAFSGIRVLAILHTVFVIPAMGFLLLFSLSGLQWLLFSPDTPGLFPSEVSFPGFAEGLQWYLFAAYVTCSTETSAAFVADSRQPDKTLQFLKISAWLVPVVALGCTWILMRLGTEPGIQGNTFNNLVTSASPFWGEWASIFITLLLTTSLLLSSGTAVAMAPRMLYQLGVDGHLSPVFTVVNRAGVLQPALIFSFFISLLSLAWGDVDRIVLITGTSFLAAIMLFHAGMWLQRHREEVLGGPISGVLFCLEAIVLVVVAIAFDWREVLLGLAIPAIILVVDAAIRRIAFAPFHPRWWSQIQFIRRDVKTHDFVILQVGILLFLICGATLLGWGVGAVAQRVPDGNSPNLLVILVISVAFLGLAIAAWTSLPQITAIAELQQQTEQRLLAALQTVPDTILLLNNEGMIRQANKAAASLFGLSLSSLVGMPLNGLVAGLPIKLKHWLRYSEYQLLNAPREKVVEMTFSPIANRDKAEYIVILRDISDRKLAERERIHLLQQEQAARVEAEIARGKISNILESITDAFLAVDRDWRLIYFNTQAEKLLQQSREEVLGKNLWSSFAEAVDLPFYTESHKALAEQVAIHYEAFYPPVNIWFECHCYPSSEGLSIYFRDITERKKAEEAIRNTLEKEQEISSIKSRFITTMSHEFRTPLASILSSTELIEHYGHKLPQEEKNDLFEQVRTAVEQMTRLLDDILAINKSNPQNTTLSPTQFSLQNFCRSLSEEMQRIAGDKNVISFLGIGNCTSVRMDEKILRHILTNLLSNAIKFSPDSGAIEFSVSCQKDKAIFKIKDFGIGIPEAELENLFGEFYRGSNVGNIGGTGLGLSIVKRMVDLHHGEIIVDSKVGRGTTFLVTLPYLKEK